MTTTTTTLARPQARDDGALYVLFHVGATTYAIAAHLVLQMESFTGATPVPGAPPFVAGLVQIRGRIVPVVDLRVVLGTPVGAPTLENRIIVGQLGERCVALLVDSAREVTTIRGADITPPPPVATRDARAFVTGVAQRGEALVMIVDFASLIGVERLDGQ